MARTKPFFRPQIDASIQEKLELKRHEIRYRGSMASFVESILERYADGLLEEVKAGPARAEFAGFDKKEKQPVHEKRDKRSAA